MWSQCCHDLISVVVFMRDSTAPGTSSSSRKSLRPLMILTMQYTMVAGVISESKYVTGLKIFLAETGPSTYLSLYF